MRPGTPVVHLLRAATPPRTLRAWPPPQAEEQSTDPEPHVCRAPEVAARRLGSRCAHAPVCNPVARERGACAVGLERLQGAGTSTCAGRPLPRQREAPRPGRPRSAPSPLKREEPRGVRYSRAGFGATEKPVLQKHQWAPFLPNCCGSCVIQLKEVSRILLSLFCLSKISQFQATHSTL